MKTINIPIPPDEEHEDERREREASLAIRYLALHVLSAGDATRVLREVEALGKNPNVSIEERVLLYEKWRHSLWLDAAAQGGESLRSLCAELQKLRIVVPEMYEASP